MYRFSAILIKIPVAFFTKIEQIIVKFVWNHKKLKKPKESLERRAKLEASHFLISKYITKLYQSKQYSIGIKIHIDQKKKTNRFLENPLKATTKRKNKVKAHARNVH